MPTFLVRCVAAVALAIFSSCSCGTTRCSDSNPCTGGAVCGPDGTCLAPTLVTVQVSDPAARGCEVLLTEQSGSAIVSAQFGPSVVGTSLREAPRFALTFVSAKDQAIGSDGVQLALASGNAGGLAVTKASCVDVNGGKLAGATVSLR